MTERELFVEALKHPAGDARIAFLADACGDNEALRARVERLLTLHDCPSPVLGARPENLLAAMADPTDARENAAGCDQLKPYLGPPLRPDAFGRLGNYDLLSVLGIGGFGIVVKAFDATLQRVVAVKVLAPHLAATSPPRKRFLREAMSTAQVKHDGVVQIYSIEAEPIPYLVMEFVEGLTLQEMLDRDGPFAATEVVRIGVQVALGLAAAHEQGLVHRDVKPANILLEAVAPHRVKLTDFGLARAADDASLTQTGILAGTPLYMSPEQARNEELDHRTDLFSLGSVLYSLAAGRPPFRAKTTLAVLNRVAEDRPRPIREVIADIPDGLWAVIERMLQKKPADRFPTARAAAEALDRCLTDPIPFPLRTAHVRRRRMVVATAVVLAIAAAVGWNAWPQNTGSPDKQVMASEAERNRRAAEAILFASGSVWVNGEEREIKAEAELPVEPFTLTRVSLENHKRVDHVLSRLRGLTGLTRIELSHSSLTDEGLGHLEDCTGLTTLEIHLTDITDAGLARLKRLNKLEQFGGNFIKVSDEGMAFIAANHPEMSQFAVTNTAIGDAGLEHLKKLKKLRKLYIGGIRMTDVGMAHVAQLADLDLLDLWGAGITAAGVAELKVLRKLEWLRLRNVPIGDAGLAHLHGCTALKYLGVQESTGVTAEAVAAFHAAVPGCRIEHNGPTVEPGH